MSAQDVLTHVVSGTGPPLVLLNGGLMSLSAWDAVVAGLQADLSVIRCDFRGQLLTPGPAPESLAGHATDVLLLLDYLGVSKAHVVGTSFGALVGLTMASEHPSRVRTLTAITATDRITSDMWAGALALRAACREAASGGDRAAVFDLIVPATFSAGYRQRFAAQLVARREAMASLPRVWFAGLEVLLDSLQGVDLRPLLPGVICPTLVLAAGRDETFPVAHSQTLAAALSNGRLRIVPDAPHGLAIEEPAVVIESLKEFLSAEVAI